MDTGLPESILSFTWLVERPEKEGISWIIPAFAISMIIAVPASIYFLVRNDVSMTSIGQEGDDGPWTSTPSSINLLTILLTDSGDMDSGG